MISPARDALPAAVRLDFGARSLELMLTTGCNLGCAYCYQQKRKPRTMAPETVDAAVRRLAASCYDRPMLVFYGGEPLLAVPLVRRALDRVRQWAPPRMRPDVQIVTNGIRLDEVTARLLVGRDVFIVLSFDGVEAAQDDRAPGTFERLDALLLRLARDHPKHFRERFGVKVTLTSRNAPLLSDSFHYFLSRGVRDVDIYPVLPDDTGWSPRLRRVLGRQLAEVERLSLREFRRTGAIPFRPFRGSAAGPPAGVLPTCGCASRGHVFVDVDGSLAPCSRLAASTLDSQPWAVRRVGKVLGGLHLTDPDVPGALFLRERHARRLRFLAGPETRQAPRGACANCKALSTCFVCPVAVACNRGRVPQFHCDVNWLFARHRDAFRVAAKEDPNSKAHTKDREVP